MTKTDTSLSEEWASLQRQLTDPNWQRFAQQMQAWTMFIERFRTEHPWLARLAFGKNAPVRSTNQNRTP